MVSETENSNKNEKPINVVEKQQTEQYIEQETKIVNKKENSEKIDTQEEHKDWKQLQPNDFEKIKLIGKGDVGKVYLVRLKGTNQLYAMKVLSKKEMIKRNKVYRYKKKSQLISIGETCVNRKRNFSNNRSSFYRYTLLFISNF